MNINRPSERKWFCTKKKTRSRQYPTETIIDVDYADDPALPTNTPFQHCIAWSWQQDALLSM